jgi:hypothetical protein
MGYYSAMSKFELLIHAAQEPDTKDNVLECIHFYEFLEEANLVTVDRGW